VNGFVGVGVGRCIVEEAVGGGKVVLRVGRLMEESLQTTVRRERSSALAYKNKDPTTCWIHVFLPKETGVERVVVDEGERWRENSVGR
jgi:hypothetical protein